MRAAVLQGLELVGFAAVVYGLWLVAPALAFVVGGMVLVVGAGTADK